MFKYGKYIFLAILLFTNTVTTAMAHKFTGYDDLVSYFNDPTRKDNDVVIIPPIQEDEFRYGPPHNIYKKLCWIFAHYTPFEYLGFTRYVPGSHYNIRADTDNDGKPELYDVGYFGSPEHMVLDFVHKIHQTGIEFSDSFYEQSFIGTHRCENLRPIPDYGECDSEDFYWGGYDYIVEQEEEISYIDQFIDVYEGNPLMGCNDYRTFLYPKNDFDNSETYFTRQDFRRIIKAFIDNNIPLTVRVAGHHNHTLIGYAEVDDDGLPRTAIGVDSLKSSSNTPIYYVYENIDSHSSWHIWDDYSSIWNIRAFNQHLDGGCKKNGWAKKLDDSLTYENHKICPMPVTVNSFCNQDKRANTQNHVRYYDINIKCKKDGMTTETYHATEIDPFVTVPRNVVCDSLMVSYGTTENSTLDNSVKTAEVRRYGYDEAKNKWEKLTRYDGSVHHAAVYAGRSGAIQDITFDDWPKNYRLVGQKIGGQYSKRRSTIELQFESGDSMTVEIAPPGTYGVCVVGYEDGKRCYHKGLEADHNKTMYPAEEVSPFSTENTIEWQFLMETKNIVCDKVELWIALGNFKKPISAKVTQFGYSKDSGQWEVLPNLGKMTPDRKLKLSHSGHTGNVYRFIWDQKWPENRLLVNGWMEYNIWAEQMTVFTVKFDDGSIRNIEITQQD